MSVFSRSFNVDALAKWDADHPGNAVRMLFERWALPGRGVTDTERLRVGVRKGYLNFYAKGQSVAKLSVGRNGPKVSVHEAYVSGRARSALREGLPAERAYISFDAQALLDPGFVSSIDQWIDTADTYATAEKRFVDDLVASNPGVIDLEMGLPASGEPDRPRVAPRMDIVLATMGGEGPTIEFWEAKCANNPELRATIKHPLPEAGGLSEPKVLKQVNKYVEWMRDVDRVSQVQIAYKAAATCFLEFHHLFRRETSDKTPDCVAIWQAFADATNPRVVETPGVVIGNYLPDGCTDGIASQRMKQAAISFARDGHRQRLKDNRTSVLEVASKGAKLPSLPVVSA